jgi:Rho GTPase-activating protein RGD1
MNPQQNMSMPHMAQLSPQGQFPVQPLGPGPGPGPTLAMQGRTNTGGYGPSGSPQGFLPGGPPTMSGAQAPRPSSQQHNRSFSQGALLNQQAAPPQQQQQMRNSTAAVPQSRFNPSVVSQGPPQLGALPFQSSQPGPQDQQPPRGPVQGPGGTRGMRRWERRTRCSSTPRTRSLWAARCSSILLSSARDRGQ